MEPEEILTEKIPEKNAENIVEKKIPENPQNFENYS